MAVTLAQAKLNVTDALQQGVIDEFRKENFILDNITFDDVVSPAGGGAGMVYAYNRLITQPTAAFRAINADYTASEVTKQQYTAELKILGGAFEIDRVIANMGGVIDEVSLQIAQKVKATSALWNDTFINGDTANDANSFDGLDKAVTGSSTEFNATGSIDLSTSANVTSNYVEFLDMLDEFLSTLDGKPSFIAGNTKLIAKIRACARRSAAYTTELNDFGGRVEYYQGIPLVDLRQKAGSNTDIVATDGSGYTSLYAARLGLDGLHGISMAGVAPIVTRLPNFADAGTVKRGDVEMVSAIALKATKAAGVFRKIKVS